MCFLFTILAFELSTNKSLTWQSLPIAIYPQFPFIYYLGIGIKNMDLLPAL
jgi:hypothetical protein